MGSGARGEIEVMDSGNEKNRLENKARSEADHLRTPRGLVQVVLCRWELKYAYRILEPKRELRLCC